MKIICIGRNYVDHAKELKNEVPKEPLFFLKPDTAILPKRNPFYIPDFSEDVHHELELVVRINRLGKNIDEKFASRYYNEITVGLDFTARDLQAVCKTKGHPWEKAKAFDGSAPLGRFVELKKDDNVQNMDIELLKNGETVQKGSTADMIFTVDHLISYVSRFMTLKIGDLLFTGTPAGVGPVSVNDKLEAKLNGETLLKLNVKSSIPSR